MEKKEYLISGNTYVMKEDLLANKCTWIPSIKSWKTPPLSKDDLAYMRISSMISAIGADMVPANLDGDAKKIQDILNRS